MPIARTIFLDHDGAIGQEEAWPEGERSWTDSRLPCCAIWFEVNIVVKSLELS